MLILCTTLRPFVRLELTCISTSGNHTSSHTIIPIFFPLGSILLKFLNLRLRFYSTSTKLPFQLKILIKDFLKEFSTRSLGSWYKSLFISFVVVKKQEKSKGKSYILDFHNFAVDVQPQIHGAITRLKNNSDNIVSLISPMNFVKYLWETAIIELDKNINFYETVPYIWGYRFTLWGKTQVFYTHLDSVVARGAVKKGDLLGYVGQPPRPDYAWDTHLHIALKEGKLSTYLDATGALI